MAEKTAAEVRHREHEPGTGSGATRDSRSTRAHEQVAPAAHAAQGVDNKAPTAAHRRAHRREPSSAFYERDGIISEIRDLTRAVGVETVERRRASSSEGGHGCGSVGARAIYHRGALSKELSQVDADALAAEVQARIGAIVGDGGVHYFSRTGQQHSFYFGHFVCEDTDLGE